MLAKGEAMATSTPTIPDQVEPKGLGDYLEVMTRAVFQAGLSWSSIAQRWDRYRSAFGDFNTTRVAGYDEMCAEIKR